MSYCKRKAAIIDFTHIRHGFKVSVRLVSFKFVNVSRYSIVKNHLTI